MKGGGTERRKYPRTKPEPGTVILVTRDEAGSVPAANLVQRIIDVSALGVCFVSTIPVSEGVPVKAEITLPGQKAKISTRGVVRWTTFLESKGRQANVLGIEFDQIVDGLSGKGGDSAVLDIFLTLRVAVAQLRLYPKDSPQVLKVTTETYHSIHSFLESANTLTLSMTPKGLLVNGRPLPDRGTISDSLESAMVGLLMDAGVKSISFKKGLTVDELITFLHALTRKFWDVKDGKEINRRLRDERVNQVSVDEVQYVALGEGDIVIEDAARKLAGGDTELANLIGNLEQLIDAASQEGLGGEARVHLMKRLIEQDPELLRKSGAGGGQAEAKEEEGRIPLEQARLALGELALLLKEAPEPLRTPVRTVGKVLVDSFRHSPRLSAMMASMLSDAVAQAVAQAIPASGVDESAAVQRLRGILSMPDDERIAAIAQEGSALLDELAALGQGDMMQTLIASASSTLHDRISKRRLATVRAFNSLRRGVERSGGDALIDGFEQSVRSAIDMERDGAVYAVLAELIAFLADLRIRRGRIDRSREVLELLNRHYQIKEPSFPQRGELAYIALERVASGVGFASLADKVRAGDAEATRIIEALDAAATRFLIREIKNAETPARRLHFASFIARAGAGAATVLMDELQKTSVPSDVIHLIEVLPHAMPGDMAEMSMGGLLKHAAVAVRRRVAGMLSEQSFPRAGGLILDALNAESDGQTRLVYVECLGRLRHRASVDVLNRIIEDRQQPEDVRCAACVAVGRTGDPRSVSVLARMYYKGEKGFTKMLKLVPAAVRAAAARALASFPAVPEARDALRSAREDHDPTVRAVASQALYAPIQDAFGERALGVQMASNAAGVSAVVKCGGTLQEVPLETVIQRLGAQEATGLLLVSFIGPSARVFFDAGLVIAAEFESRRDHEAFVFMGNRREGFWLFIAGETTLDRRILAPVSSLLDDLLRSRAGATGKPGSSAKFPTTE